VLSCVFERMLVYARESAVDCSMDVRDVQLAVMLRSVLACIFREMPEAVAEERHETSIYDYALQSQVLMTI